MGRGKSTKQKGQYKHVDQDGVGLEFWKRKRPTRNQAPPPTLPNVDVHGILFAIVAVVFVVYPLAQYFLGL